ncbi:SDR family oxidoreductase [Parasphingorhabdus halotolerans]|uniref:SDR family oxidoreductase n=1 Tax=Parasphingorhabdus halotolerans TaxID=2725558 RepID=A0A6H2DQW0_9SPHN|nr:SDR family oxidoreductase [Parasphingorhabdus halotolerans]QJB70151.1 SDR family oxidoreductase [Parasphingorhabdus halotolerans]
MGRLEGKKSVILGAAGQGNMGQVIAKRFRDEGADVLVAGRKEDELKRFATEISGHYALCDLTVEADIQALAESAKSQMGGVDIAINATGVGFLKPFLENTREELEMMAALQLTGPFQFYQAMIKAMSDNKPSGGSLIQISSATATIMLNDHAAYMGTKAATDHIIRCVAHEFGEHGIRANSISPGLTRTPMTAGVDQVPGLVESFEARYPLGRIGTSEDIAAAAVFLASDECYMTGENLQVNGGLCLRGNPTRKDQELMMGAIAAAS